MSVPAIIVTVLQGLSILLAANQHGKEQKNHNFWTSLLGALIMCYLLWWGGFYNQPCQ